MRGREPGPWIAGITALAAMIIALAFAGIQIIASASGFPGDWCSNAATEQGSAASSGRLESGLSLAPFGYECTWTQHDGASSSLLIGPGWWPVLIVGAGALVLVLSILTPAIRNARSRPPVRASG